MGAYGHHLSLTTPMTAAKVGTSYLKLTIPLHVLPSYFKNRTALCCDRYEYGLFTAASTLVVRVRSVYAARWSPGKIVPYVSSMGIKPIASCIINVLLG